MVSNCTDSSFSLPSNTTKSLREPYYQLPFYYQRGLTLEIRVDISFDSHVRSESDG